MECEAYHKSSMIEVEGNISQIVVSILIDLGSTLSYVSTTVVEKCKLTKEQHKNAWLVQLATRTKRKVIEIVKNCVIEWMESWLKQN